MAKLLRQRDRWFCCLGMALTRDLGPSLPWRNYIGTGVALEPKLQRLASNPQTLRTPSQALGFKVRTHAGKHSSCVLLHFGRGQFRTSSYTSAI